VIRLLPLLSILTGCTVVLVDDLCDTSTPPDTADTGDTGIADDTATPPPYRFTDIGTGAVHTCGILASGELLCWGANDEGQLDAPSGTFVSLSVGHAHACALTPEGETQCWGRNDEGQTELTGTFLSVTAGGAHSCGLTVDGTVECSGRNDHGQALPPDGTFLSIVAGANHTCGTVTGETDNQESVCWGSLKKSARSGENHGQMIAGTEWTCSETFDADEGLTYSCIGDDSYGQHNVPAGLATDTLTGGARHGCGLTDTQEIVCWGSDDAGQTDAPDGSFSRVSAGPTSLHTCALETVESDPGDGSPVVCWGLDAENQLSP
jgi:hypothetical protein